MLVLGVDPVSRIHREIGLLSVPLRIFRLQVPHHPVEVLHQRAGVLHCGRGELFQMLGI